MLQKGAATLKQGFCEIEAWGSGIARMLEACKEAGLDSPEFKVADGGVWLVFCFSTSYMSAQGRTGKIDQEIGSAREKF